MAGLRLLRYAWSRHHEIRKVRMANGCPVTTDQSNKKRRNASHDANTGSSLGHGEYVGPRAVRTVAMVGG